MARKINTHCVFFELGCYSIALFMLHSSLKTGDCHNWGFISQASLYLSKVWISQVCGGFGFSLMRKEVWCASNFSFPLSPDPLSPWTAFLSLPVDPQNSVPLQLKYGIVGSSPNTQQLWFLEATTQFPPIIQASCLLHKALALCSTVNICREQD